LIEKRCGRPKRSKGARRLVAEGLEVEGAARVRGWRLRVQQG